MSVRAYTMRELLTKARERFGPDAARLKTREELVAALELDASTSDDGAASEPATTEVPLVVRDFFLPR